MKCVNTVMLVLLVACCTGVSGAELPAQEFKPLLGLPQQVAIEWAMDELTTHHEFQVALSEGDTLRCVKMVVRTAAEGRHDEERPIVSALQDENLSDTNRELLEGKLEVIRILYTHSGRTWDEWHTLLLSSESRPELIQLRDEMVAAIAPFLSELEPGQSVFDSQ